ETRRSLTQANLSDIQKQLLTATMLRDDLASARDSQEARYVRQVDHLAFLEALENVDADGQGNLRVLQEPTLEQEKIGPERVSLLLKGLLVGLGAAVALALMRQRFERRLRHPDSYELACGEPVLGVVPHLSSLRRQTRRAASEVG
ncbi:MAG TPA: hypothetical protein VMT18_06120, partial [Planctomycetota bacterium]|nr:hypothetical protein [Planctomycetota bacterium]